jgi:hypothetical protein
MLKNSVLNTSLPFVHTARRFFRLILIVSCKDLVMGELLRMLCIGGRKSRNKVIVGEPAIGSLLDQKNQLHSLVLCRLNFIQNLMDCYG